MIPWFDLENGVKKVYTIFQKLGIAVPARNVDRGARRVSDLQIGECIPTRRVCFDCNLPAGEWHAAYCSRCAGDNLGQVGIFDGSW